MRWILNLNKKYKLPYLWANFWLIFFDSIGFIVPILIGSLVDMVTVNHNYDNLFLVTVCIILFVILKMAGSYFAVIKVNMVVENIVSEIKQRCYQNINKLDYYFYEHKSHGELMTNFTSDIKTIRKHLNYNIKTIGAVGLTFVFSLGYLLSINLPFTLLLLFPGFLVGIVSFGFVKKTKNEYQVLRDLMADANDFVSDNIEGNKVVKTFAIESQEIKKVKKINQKYIEKDIEIAKIEDAFYAKVDFLRYLMNVIFLLVGGYLFIKGKVTLGELIIFNSYLYNLSSPFTRLSGLINSIQRFLIAKVKILNLIQAQPKIVLNGEEHLDSLLVPIEFRNVRIVFENKVVLENLNITIKPYETIAFIGKTGSGKSSIVNLLLGLIVPESGEVLIKGRNYLDFDIKDIRYKVGYVTQNAFLFSDTIYNNIRYGNMDVTREEASKYAKIACCDYIEKLPLGIDTVIGERGVGLSGGEKQRLSLARALAVKPDILLLDDITSALDMETEEKINESIKTLDYKSTKIIIASKIVSVMNADKIYVLDEGKVIESGNHKELIKKKGYYYELFNIQNGEL